MSCSPPPPPPNRRPSSHKYPQTLKRSFTNPNPSKTRSVLADITGPVLSNSNLRRDGGRPNPFSDHPSRRTDDQDMDIDQEEIENIVPRFRRAVTMPATLQLRGTATTSSSQNSSRRSIHMHHLPIPAPRRRRVLGLSPVSSNSSLRSSSSETEEETPARSSEEVDRDVNMDVEAREASE